MRPRLLRPPVRLSGTSRLFSGSFLLSSEKSAICMKRWPGVRGFNCMTAISFLFSVSLFPVSLFLSISSVSLRGLQAFEEFDLVAFLESYVGLLPVHLAALDCALLPFLAHEVRSADLEHGDLEQMLDGLANFVLARAGAHAEQHLAGLFAGHGALLGDDGRENQALGTAHFASPANRASIALAVRLVITSSR